MRLIEILAPLTVLCLVLLFLGYTKRINKKSALLGALLCWGSGAFFLVAAVLPWTQFYGPVSINGVATTKKIALTFDDGPYEPYTKDLLAVLQQKNVRVTFFMVGENAVKNPQLVKAVAQGGHQIGIHAWQHRDFLRLSRAKMRMDLMQSCATIEALTGKRPVLFRPPHGFKDFAVLKEAATLGLTVVNWNVLPRDWTNPGIENLVNKIVKAARPGAIVLLHDGDSPYNQSSRAQTVAATGKAIDILRGEGYEFVTVEELLYSGKD
ncbi:MAG TPA: polysaccharide deacetylase family protein [Candidatus Avacidaminococcus intestinavium]|uniref:Polysaccharide deacetylase family protein n=1 Tax=Candidatus Avacidaminococcus intestinavium TaxID=2840684 RepID=A0A9D1MQV2_9FIRM|nr:polysaccharide deacetylase family protein [Candidatus Avacidaminococcus intestinavium]